MSDGWNNERADPVAIGGQRTTRAERRRAAQRERIKRRRRVALLSLIVVFLVVIGGVLWTVRGSLFGGSAPDDYASGQAGPEVVVHIVGQNNSDFAQNLVDAGVVKSVGAFNQAAGDKPISAGYYELRKTLPAAEAVTMLVDPARSHRVGMLNVSAGAVLDDKRSKDNKVAQGIFSQLSAATAHTVDGVKKQTPKADFVKVASSASVADLGVPEWAAGTVTRLKGDHRRIEGLIAPGVWDQIDPSATPIAILRQLITASAKQYEAQGLLTASRSSPAKLAPYQVLVSASIVEREVNQADDYPKVARVILNRLAKNQKLEMDSTVNYGEAVTGIDVAGEKLLKKTEWNTYAKTGLPATPIGAVGTDALVATENPAPGPWLYFVTVDNQGTTLFTDDFAQHERNRQKACDTKFLTVGCGP
ncbi:endolytic transglycosylase MltG [Tsukamurella paurometabola]|uniref:Endolytic murein transglycosylase n=1 Tax=Tsukamurella paurometabola TaxID=2061 RepID=A0A3P8LGZ7_TSUPA|nr:endolytic transglycosylase MltG [Tsukamurella paurometabola]MBS4099817.1 endolytic transglycosylase MltG [Tsukamurella paurometabola]UEA83816.1 endolytic transglycosylase MltG [Tsukamurella paurometabola]VDR40962.1 putative aminodeoxychorismate lyase [Tsukamurella paurometabola]